MGCENDRNCKLVLMDSPISAGERSITGGFGRFVIPNTWTPLSGAGPASVNSKTTCMEFGSGPYDTFGFFKSLGRRPSETPVVSVCEPRGYSQLMSKLF